MSKSLIAPFRFANYEGRFRHNKKWFQRISGDCAVSMEGKADYQTLHLDTLVGFELIDLTDNQIRRIEKYYKPTYGD